MSSFNDYQIKSYIAGTDLAAYIRVKKSGDNVVAAGAGEAAIGVTIVPAASGNSVSVKLANSFGTALITASGAFSANVALYGDASGKVSSTPAGAVVGYSEEAATASGDIVEVLLRGSISSPAVANANQAAVTDATTDGVAGASGADLPGLAAETEHIGDTVRALVVLVNVLRARAIATGDITGAA